MSAGDRRSKVKGQDMNSLPALPPAGDAEAFKASILN